MRGLAHPTVQTLADIPAEHGGRPLKSEEVHELFGRLPSDGGRLTVADSLATRTGATAAFPPLDAVPQSTKWKEQNR